MVHVVFSRLFPRIPSPGQGLWAIHFPTGTGDRELKFHDLVETLRSKPKKDDYELLEMQQKRTEHWLKE